ncbi:hypothetical protein GDO86_014146, partial [Hymenochirus boettgeri]
MLFISDFWSSREKAESKMKTIAVAMILMVALTVFTESSPILPEKQAKQVLRTKRSERERKPGHHDEPMR